MIWNGTIRKGWDKKKPLGERGIPAPREILYLSRKKDIWGEGQGEEKVGLQKKEKKKNTQRENFPKGAPSS